jgi:hypothetical protein
VSREAGDRGSAGGCAAPTFGAHGPEGIRIGEYPAFHCDEAADSVKSGAGHLTGHRASAAREGWIRSGRGFIFLIPRERCWLDPVAELLGEAGYNVEAIDRHADEDARTLAERPRPLPL